jgi:hypothetical protein
VRLGTRTVDARTFVALLSMMPAEVMGLVSGALKPTGVGISGASNFTFCCFITARPLGSILIRLDGKN